MDVDLKRLEQVLAVVRAGSISGAAEELHLTQPALSRSIAVLEERYGFRIFERGRGGSTLTAIGKSVVAEAEELLRRARSTDHNFRLFGSGEAGHIAFGMGPLIASLVLPSLNLHFLRERPELHFKAVTRSAADLYRELMDDRIEVLFCGGNQLGAESDVLFQSVGEIGISLIVRGGHPLAVKTGTGKKAVSLDDTSSYPLLCGAEMAPERGARSAGIFICDNYHILRNNTLDSDAVWISSPELVSEDIQVGRLQSLDLLDSSIQQRVEVFMVSRKANQLSPGALAIREHVRGKLGAGAAD